MLDRFVLTSLLLFLMPSIDAFAVDIRKFVDAPRFKPVDAFSRNALFLAKDRKLWTLRTTDKGSPQAIFTISKNGERNSAIGISENEDAFFVSDGELIFRVTGNGESKVMLRQSELRAEGLNRPSESRFDINWLLAAGPHDVLYFDVLPAPKKGGESLQFTPPYVCRYDPMSKTTQALAMHFPTGIDIDCQRGILYVPPIAHADAISTNHRVLITDFAGRAHTRRLAVSYDYDWCRLSADGKTLLLSEVALTGPAHIATLDIETGRETVLPFSGTYAVWGEGNSIYFVGGETTLWTATVAAKEPTKLFEAVGQPASEKGKSSYVVEPPVLSRDHTWLAWRSAVKGWIGAVDEKTALIDLKNREYRLLYRSWNNLNWAK